MVEYANAFQAENGLPVKNVITPEMQALLFSDYALAKATPTPRPTATPRPSPTSFVEPDIILEVSRTADWGGKRSTPWVQLSVRSHSQAYTATSVGIIYCCVDAEGNNLVSEKTGETHNVATLDATVRPGRKVTLPKIKIEDYTGVADLWTALYGWLCAGGRHGGYRARAGAGLLAY